MATEKQVEANRRNAKRSTGPRTPGGKARSAANAVTHGLTAEAPVLPGEDPGALAANLGQWEADMAPRNAAERALVTRAALACWRLDRCARAESARMAREARHAALAHDLDQQRRAEELGKPLLNDPINRHEVPARDPATAQRLATWNALEPALLTRELQTFAPGIDWLIARWQELDAILDREGYWHFPEKFAAIRLLGRRPDLLLRDAVVGRIFAACNTLHPEPWHIQDDAIQSCLGLDDRPNYYKRVDHLALAFATTPAEAFDFLRELVATEVARLQTLKSAGLDEAERLDRAEAPTRALLGEVTLSPLVVRYEAAHERALHRALNDLIKLKTLESPEPEPEPTPHPVSPEPIPAPPGPRRAEVEPIPAPQPGTDTSRPRPRRNKPNSRPQPPFAGLRPRLVRPADRDSLITILGSPYPPHSLPLIVPERLSGPARRT